VRSAGLVAAALVSGALLAPSPSRAQCPCPGAEAAPPPPNTPGWEHIETTVTAWLNDPLNLRASVHALVTTEDGEPSFTGGFLTVTNRGRCPFWFGLSGVLNVGVMPGEQQRIPLAQYRRPDDRTPTRVPLFGVHCTSTASANADAGVPDGGAALPGRYMCGVLVCCVPGTLAPAGGCTCPLNATFRPEPGNILLGRCTCVPGATWDPDLLQCVHRHCPAGMIYRDADARCECPDGLRWDAARRGCVRDTCTGGSTWSAALRRCSCPDARAWSSAARACIDPGCTGGTVYDQATETCVCPERAPLWDAASDRCMTCPSTQVWTGSACECPSDRPLWSEDGRRCAPCPRGTSWDGGECVCDAPAPRWNVAARRCEPCPRGESWDVGQRACLSEPVCSPPCAGNQACVAGVCVGSGRLRITLTWGTPGDVDLHVLTPGGERIYYAHRSAAGGQLDRDDTSGTGPENVYWDGAPPPGAYTICVDPYRVSGATSFEVTVLNGGRVERFSGVRTSDQRGACSAGSANYVGTIHVP